MELAIIGLIIVVAVWYGLLKPVETLAAAADDEVTVLAAERKAVNVKRLSTLDIKETDVKAAQKNLAHLMSVKL